MKEIKNYKVKEFIKRPEEVQKTYTRLLMMAAPRQPKKQLWDLEFGFVFSLVENGLKDFKTIVKTVAKLQGIKKKQVFELRIVDFFGIVVFANDQIKQAIKGLSSINGPVVPKWEIVNGSERMAKYGIANITIPMAIQLHKTPSEIEKMTFGEVFVFKSYSADMAKLEKEMSEIKMNL